jgi:GxxExxY protein
LVAGALTGLSEIDFDLELRQMFYHKGARRIPENALGDAADGLSRKIVTAALGVHKQLGPGLLESAYEACLCRELTLRGIEHERQLALPVRYQGLSLDCGYRLDLVVGELVIVEVKAVAKILPIHKAQVMTYLRLSKMRVGLIVNFNVPALRLGIYRIVHD